jgi:hypothetical protein
LEEAKENGLYLAKTESSLKIQIVADMICISSCGICGEDDFRCPREKEALTSGGNEGNFSG